MIFLAKCDGMKDNIMYVIAVFHYVLTSYRLYEMSVLFSDKLNKFKVKQNLR